MSEGRAKPGIPLWYPLVIGGVIILVVLGLPQLKRVPDEARGQTLNNFKQIAVALEGYQDVYKRLPPPAIKDKDGRPLLSWRVAILPFIEQTALYKRFHLEEPWDSPHNRELLKEQPSVYQLYHQSFDEAERRLTYIQVFVGPGTPFDPKAKCRIIEADTKGDDIPILIVEAAEPVPWTKPEDIPFDPNAPLPALGGCFSKARGHLAVVARVDASIAILEEHDRERLPHLIRLRGR